MQDPYQTIASILINAQGGTCPQGYEIDISAEAIQLMRGVTEFRATLIEVIHALDIAQAMLEGSEHHPLILAAYRRAKATLQRDT
jgi:hypothetical protein